MSLDDNTQKIDTADVKAYVGILMMNQRKDYDPNMYVKDKLIKIYLY